MVILSLQWKFLMGKKAYLYWISPLMDLTVLCEAINIVEYNKQINKLYRKLNFAILNLFKET